MDQELVRKQNYEAAANFINPFNCSNYENQLHRKQYLYK